MLFFIRLIFRNIFRRPLRSGLTVIGLVVAILAFGLLRTLVDAWYAGAEATSTTRLITRNAISLVFPLPISYLPKIRQVPGVVAVSYANWFGGIYISEKNFFPQFAIDLRSYLDLYPEYRLSSEDRSAFLHDRKGAIAGQKLAAQYGWKVGDIVPLRGTIYQGNWSFVLRGIYRGAEKKTDETLFFFHWNNLNEHLKKEDSSRAEHVGIYIVGIQEAAKAAEIARMIDALFKNSLAETLTETERAFQLSFVSMTEAILIVIEVVSFLVIIIIMAVMANTMAMTARERQNEYATLKAMGFGPGYILFLIGGESLMISLSGGIIGVVLTYPAAGLVRDRLGTLFPVFNVSEMILVMGVGAAFLVGLVAALMPTWRAVTMPVAQGLAQVR